MKKQLFSLLAVLLISSAFCTAQIKITTIAGLQSMEDNKSYILDADIDLTTLAGGLNKDLTNVILDGNFHTLSNLTADGVDRGGLFKNIAGSTIKNLNISNFTIAGNWSGAIAGHANNSTITRCSVVGSEINASGIAGGIIGHMESTTISESKVTGTISGHDHVGGIVGHMQNTSKVENCYVDADVITDGWQVGGIAGWSEGVNDIITNCYAAGTVSAAVGFTGGIIGAGVGGGITVSNCLAIQTILRANSDIPKTNRIVGDHGATTLVHNYGFVDMTWEDPKRTETWTSLPAGKDGVNVTLAQVANAQFYTDSLPTWDFNNVWIMDTNRPKLRMESNTVSRFNSVKLSSSKIKNINGNIAVECPLNSVITVYNTMGRVIEKRTSTSAMELFSHKGFFIIRINTSEGKEVFKVIN